MDFSRFLTREPYGRSNWMFEFPNGHTASVINSPHPDELFRFEVLTSDPSDPVTGITGLSTEQVEAKLTEVAALPPLAPVS